MCQPFALFVYVYVCVWGGSWPRQSTTNQAEYAAGIKKLLTRKARGRQKGKKGKKCNKKWCEQHSIKLKSQSKWNWSKHMQAHSCLSHFLSLSFSALFCLPLLLIKITWSLRKNSNKKLEKARSNFETRKKPYTILKLLGKWSYTKLLQTRLFLFERKLL